MFAARLKTAALLGARRIIASARVMRTLITLRRCIFGGREIASALWAASPAPSAAPPEAAPTTITAAVSASLVAEALSRTAVVAAIRARIFLSGIELAKILRSGSVRFRLAFLRFDLGRVISFWLAYAMLFIA